MALITGPLILFTFRHSMHKNIFKRERDLLIGNVNNSQLIIGRKSLFPIISDMQILDLKWNCTNTDYAGHGYHLRKRSQFLWMLQFQSWMHPSWDKLLANLDHMYSHSFLRTAKDAFDLCPTGSQCFVSIDIVHTMHTFDIKYITQFEKRNTVLWDTTLQFQLIKVS